MQPWRLSLNMIFKFIVGRVLGGSSCKWRHLVLEASRLLSLCLVVPPCWRRFITSLNKSRLHQNPIFCPIFLLFFLFVCFFSFCLLAGLPTAQKGRQISIRRQVCALWPTGWSRLPFNQLTNCRLYSIERDFMSFLGIIFHHFTTKIIVKQPWIFIAVFLLLYLLWP